MAKDDIPVQESTNGGVPVTDVSISTGSITSRYMQTPK